MHSHPERDDIKRAIDAYCAIAYQSQPPKKVQTQQQTLEQWQGDVLECPIFAREPSPACTHFKARLGNTFYPHMKMAVEVAADHSHYFFRVDTHDRHICPKPESPEYGQFCQLMEKNQKLAESIEATWEQQGLPTFKSYLREDLKRRQASMH
jgi:hypothetical protein